MQFPSLRYDKREEEDDAGSDAYGGDDVVSVAFCDAFTADVGAMGLALLGDAFRS